MPLTSQYPKPNNWGCKKCCLVQQRPCGREHGEAQGSLWAPEPSESDLGMVVRIPWASYRSRVVRAHRAGLGGAVWTPVGKSWSALAVHTERRLQGMPCLGTPARRVDVWVVGVDPEVIGMTPAVKVELWRKGPWTSGTPCGAQLSWEVL